MSKLNSNYLIWATELRTGAKIILIGRRPRTPIIKLILAELGRRTSNIAKFILKVGRQPNLSSVACAPIPPPCPLQLVAVAWHMIKKTKINQHCQQRCVSFCRVCKEREVAMKWVPRDANCDVDLQIHLRHCVEARCTQHFSQGCWFVSKCVYL